MFTGVILKVITFIPGKAYVWPIIKHVYINKANFIYFSIIAVKKNKVIKLTDRFQALNKTPKGYQKLFL